MAALPWITVGDSGYMGIHCVEDILAVVMANNWQDGLREGLLKDPWFDKFVTNVYSWAVVQNKPLTTEQARITLRILHKTRALIVEKGWATDGEIEKLLAKPQYRHPPIQSANIPREVRFLGDNLLGFRFKRNDHIAGQLKSLKSSTDEPVSRWDWVSRLWIVPITKTTLGSIMDIISENRFGFDDNVAEALAQATNAADEPVVFEFRDGQIIATANDSEIITGWLASSLDGQIL